MTGDAPSPHRWWWLVATVVVSVGLCAGYGHLQGNRRQLTEAQIVGTWCSAEGGEFAFGADRTFTAGNLLGAVMRPAVDTDTRSSGAGTWRLAVALSDRHGPPTEVHLGFRTLNGRPAAYTNNLISVLRHDRLVLLYTVGDPDNGAEYQFQRSGTPFCPS
ncbi:hypothetical protein [Dactylosporangium sp. NPDC005555]|uniref:hypothetical protein n=1 Tax=Dactylosporangium sp. NPDC005555 TaxID=3154889 RepID=UPI0033B22CA5